MSEIHSPQLQLIDLIEIARSGSFGPIRIGMRLAEFAETVGAPRSWGGFDSYDKFSCVMRFGNVEVGLIEEDCDVVVFWAKFQLYHFRKGELKFARDHTGSEIRFTNKFGSRLPSHAAVQERITQEKIAYTSKFTEPVLAETAAVMDFGNSIKFYFSKLPGYPLETVWIS